MRRASPSSTPHPCRAPPLLLVATTTFLLSTLLPCLVSAANADPPAAAAAPPAAPPAAPAAPVVPWGKSAVFMNGRWVAFDEEDEAGVPQPYPPKTDSWTKNDTTVMVSISSFRDYRCAKTLYNLFTKAAHPDRVYAGVVQQNDQGDADCLYSYCAMIKDELKIEPQVAATDQPVRVLENCPHADQVKMLRVQSAEAKGPTYGRYLGSKLLGEEEFCMQTDAHMDFEDEWDTRLLDMWGLANNEYGLLTTYVPDFDQLHLNLNGRYEVPQICKTFFTQGDKMVRNEQATNCIWLKKPKLTTSWAAGFSFGKCHAERKTPYDPHLPSLFDGEEYSKYARLWTRGYDTYTPHRSIVFHDYTHGPQTKDANAWARKYRELQRSHDRLRTLLGNPQATVKRDTPEASAMLGQWDLGTKRSLNQLIAFNGVDTRTNTIDFDNCGKLQWVPFDEGDDDDYYVAFLGKEREGRKGQTDKDTDTHTGEERRLMEGEGGGGVPSRRRGWASGGGGGAHVLAERLALPESGEGRILTVLCMMGFCLLIYSFLSVTSPLSSLSSSSSGRREKGGMRGGLGGGGGVTRSFFSSSRKGVKGV